MTAESLIFFALFIKGGGSASLKTPKTAGGQGTTPNRGGRFRRAFQQGFQEGRNKAKGSKQSAMKSTLGGAVGGAAKGAAAGGPMGAVGGGLAGAGKGLIGGLKQKAAVAKNTGGGAAGGAAKGAAIGGLKGFAAGGPTGAMAGALRGGLAGLRKGAQQGKAKDAQIPNKDLRASNEAKRGFLPNKIPGLGKAQNKIPQKDPRDPANAAQQGISNVKNKYDALNKKMEQATKKVGGKVGESMTGIPAPLIEKAIAVAFVVEKYRQRVLIIFFLVIFLLLFMLFDDSAGLEPQPNQNQTGTPITSDTCTPAQFANGQADGKTSVCTITVTDDGSAQDIIITDTILPGTKFVSAGQNGTYDKASNTVTWDAQQLGFQLNPVSITVSVVVQITTKQNNVTVWNAYTINPVGLSGTSSSGGGGTTGGTIPSGGNYNTRTWAIALLQGLGIPQSTGAITAIMHWEAEEGGNWHNQAKYNPLNTTYPEPGSTTFQSVGAGSADIRIYTSWQQGLDATVKTLEESPYKAILAALREGDYNAVGQAVIASPWGTVKW